MQNAIVILRVSLSGSAGTFPAGATLTTTEEEALRMVQAGIAYYATTPAPAQVYETTASKPASNRQKRKKR